MYLAKAFTAAAALLFFVTTAHAYSSIPLGGDASCPKGFQPTFVQNSYRYDGHLQKFTNITGSFFDAFWNAGTVVTSTTGTDNVPGATRAASLGDASFNETLTMFDAPPGALRFTYIGPGPKPIAYTPPGEKSIRFDYWAETQRFESICGGEATYIDVITYLCSDPPRAAYDLWYRFHDLTFNAISAEVGAKVFTGDCPRAS
ncbi:hypothetical protein C8J57DRAFT_1627653 [Mycena rebaudengoi]|nr:hypothetical protein C8J57DRAFT_1627653 [Mycena rebaudengoi]